MLPVVLVVAGVLGVGALWLYVTGARRESPRVPTAPNAGDEPEVERGAEETALVLLLDNAWDACAFDGYEETWRRFTADEVRGFAGVPGGRHRVVTRCAGAEARLEFVVAPGEVFAARLDPAAARFRVLQDPPARPQDSALVLHRMVLGVARAMRGDAIVPPDAVVERTVREVERMSTRKNAGEGEEVLLRDAERLGEALIGVPLSRAHLRTLRAALVAASGAVPGVAAAVLPDAQSSIE